MSRVLGGVLVATALLVAVAILGYLTGQGESSSPSPGSFTTANSTVTIRYPSSWRKVAGGLPIPGLSFQDPLVLAPMGDVKRAGLLAGRLAHTSTSPLPPRLLAELRRVPNTEVVGLRGAEAFRYPDVDLAGVSERVTLYSIPASAGNATGIACYAARTSSDYLRECDQMVASLGLNVQMSSDVLVPNQTYAKQLEAAIGPIDALRVRLRPRLANKPTPTTVSALARRLANGFSSPLSSLGNAQPPSAASAMHLDLIKSLTRIHDAYLTLAGATTLKSPSRYAAARADVGRAEANLGTTLGELHLIGY